MINPINLIEHISRQYIEGKLTYPIVGNNLPSDPRARGESYCLHATQIFTEYFCTAKECRFGNQSKETLDWQGEDNPLPFCLSKGLEKTIGEEELKKNKIIKIGKEEGKFIKLTRK